MTREPGYTAGNPLQDYDQIRVYTSCLCTMLYSMQQMQHLPNEQSKASINTRCIYIFVFLSQEPTSSVDHIELAYGVTYNIEQLLRLINVMTPSADLQTLTLHCRPEGITYTSIHRQKVRQLEIKGCYVDITDVVNLIHHLDVDQLVMDKVTLHINAKVSCSSKSYTI